MGECRGGHFIGKQKMSLSLLFCSVALTGPFRTMLNGDNQTRYLDLLSSVGGNTPVGIASSSQSGSLVCAFSSGHFPLLLVSFPPFFPGSKEKQLLTHLDLPSASSPAIFLPSF